MSGEAPEQIGGSESVGMIFGLEQLMSQCGLALLSEVGRGDVTAEMIRYPAIASIDVWSKELERLAQLELYRALIVVEGRQGCQDQQRRFPSACTGPPLCRVGS